MSKNLKKIVALAMALGTISAVAPAVSNANFLITKAYASSDSNDNDKFDSLKLETSDGSIIKLYDDDSYGSDNKVDNNNVDPDTDYYAKTSSNTIHININGVSSKYVRVFKRSGDNDISNSTKGKKVSSDVSLSSGKNTIVVRIYDEEPDNSPRYDDDSNKSNDYTIHVKCTGNDSSDDSSDNYDAIYLSKLSINGDSISLSDSKTTYTYNVASDVDSVPIRAVPKDDTYTVTIDGSDVDDSDNYRKTVDLNKGENNFKVEIQDDSGDDRVYTLNINRGNSSSITSTSASTTTTDSTPDNATNVSTLKPSQWVKVNGNWQYNDSTGNPVKNMWVQNYYLDSNENMATGWLDYNGSWYYLGYDGAKKTDWQLVNGSWYYLDGEGRMQTGWMRDLNTGKYYYLNTNGTMASNTTISGYKLGADGAWIR